MEKKAYIAPILTAVTFKNEHGYALSNGYGPKHDLLGLLTLESDPVDGYNAQGQQNWHESTYFGSDW